jgi:hypothetical protein
VIDTTAGDELEQQPHHRAVQRLVGRRHHAERQSPEKLNGTLPVNTGSRLWLRKTPADAPPGVAGRRPRTHHRAKKPADELQPGKQQEDRGAVDHRGGRGLSAVDRELEAAVDCRRQMVRYLLPDRPPPCAPT